MHDTVGQPLAVLGRYGGVVESLCEILAVGGLPVRLRWAADTPTDQAPELPSGLHADTVAVVTVAPGDPTLGLLLGSGFAGQVVVVTWHPTDELPDLSGLRVVPAGEIRATLVAAVRAAVS